MSRPTPSRTSSSQRPSIHPYLSGNFAPIHSEQILEPCEIVAGSLPSELAGGCYVRNGGNPAYPPGSDVDVPEEALSGSPGKRRRRAKAKGRHYHWFDGDGMLHGVHFPETTSEDPRPRFTNRHLATPVLTLSLALLGSPLPSISLLIAPLSSLHRIVAAIAQTFLLAIQASVGTLSVANTNVVWWGKGLGTEAQQQKTAESALDQRLLALCESGPPLEVRLPGLETVGWDKLRDTATGSGLDEGPDGRKARWYSWRRWGLPALQEDWMTAHPRVDPVNGDLVFFSCQMFAKPYVRYSVIDRQGRHKVWKMGVEVGKAKM